VVVVGDQEMYPTYEDFRDYCKQIRTTDRVDTDSSYNVHLESMSHRSFGETKSSERIDGAGNEEKNTSQEDTAEDDEEAQDDLRAQWREHRADSMCRERVVLDVKVKAP
jgi:hypothetical protein